ncbi:unnamed protein product [Strongylus vulgaris]|uniref:Uncharacterized protein n=1 Tax=Strongylus vulgaris TaxID=40348 RepID=A0A3P7M1F0_STRVU|nr:unnamed protein product [Strongylus vulgaris]
MRAAIPGCRKFNENEVGRFDLLYETNGLALRNRESSAKFENESGDETDREQVISGRPSQQPGLRTFFTRIH